MKLAFSSNAFRKFSLRETIDAIGRIGYDGIEIMCDTPHAYPPDLTEEMISMIRSALSDHRLEISNLNAFMLCAIQDFHHPSWIEREKEKREQRVQHTLSCIRLAERLGARTISTEPGGPLNGMSREEGLDLFYEGLRKVIPYAEETGVRILIEPEPGLLIETSSQFEQFLSEIDSEAVGLNCDIGHFYCVGEDPAEVVTRLKGVIGHLHLEDIAATRVHHHLLPGEGSIDFPSLFRALREIGYDGFVTIELYPYLDNPIETARLAYHRIRPLLTKEHERERALRKGYQWWSPDQPG